MKKILQSLMTLAMLLGITQFGQAQTTYSVTVDWGIPGAVQLKTAGKIIEGIPADATSYTVTSTDQWFSVVVMPNYGYEFVSWIDPTTQTEKKSTSISGIYKFSGETVKVNLNKVEFDQTFNLKVVNGADAITVAKFNETDANFLALLKEGDNTIQYASTKNKKVDLQTAYGTSIYSVTQNGTTLAPRFATTPNSYQFEVAPGDNIEVTVFDLATLGSDVELTLDIPAGMEKVVKNIRNWTTSKFIESEIADGKLTVAVNSDLQFNLNATDYTINGVTYGGTALEVKGDEYPYVRFKADETGVVKFDVAERDYGTRTITAYVVNPEGVKIIAGNGLDGVELPLENGEDVAEEIVLKQASESGAVLDGAYTIPAGTAKKYTLTYSLRYAGIQVTEKEGYFINHTRGANLSSVIESGYSGETIYVVAAPTAPDSKAWVYYAGEENMVRINSSSKYGAMGMFSPKPGYNEYSFNLEYDAPVTIRPLGGLESLEVICDDVAQTTDDYGRFVDVPVKNGSVVRIFADGKTHAKGDVKFFLNDGATAEVTYDKVLKHDLEASNILSVYDGTEVVVKPAEKTTMLYDGEEVALAADGTYTFTTDGEIHTVTINKVAEVYDGKYTLIPANGETVESLETIVIAFDDATTASLVEGMEGDMMLVSGNNYAAWGFEVNAVEYAEHPTFEIKPQMTPSVDGAYRFYIPEGVFTIDGKTNPEIMAIFNMETPGGEILYSFDPVEEEIFASSEGYYLAIIFEDGKQAAINYDNADITLKLDDTIMEYGTDFEVYAEGNNMVLFNVFGENFLGKTGSLTLNVAEGALTVSGKPCPAINHTWTIVEAINYTVEFLTKTDEPVASLATIRIAFPEAKTAELNSEYGITLKDSKYTYNQRPKAVTPVTADYPTFDLEFDPAPTADGVYTLSIMTYAFGLDGYQQLANNVDQTFTLDSSLGVENVAADGSDADKEVYNLQGIRLTESWEELPAGLYIRGGKKVVKQ